MTHRVPPPTPGNRDLDADLGRALERERGQGLERRCPPTEGRRGLSYGLDGREVVSFCSNDYLGLAERGAQGLGERGAQGPAAHVGAGASRLVCGDLEAHREIEARFAEWLGYGDAVLFPSGFQANVSVLACLLGREDRVHSDALNHASLIDGLRLAPASRSILAHAAPPQLSMDGALRGQPGRDWWVCESVFSMDGDGPSLGGLEAHLAAGGCLYLDEAHGLGLYGGGRGRSAQLHRRPTVTVAPLGKAMGCAGAFVAASKTVCAWIRGHARSFVFSTGVSPALVPVIADNFERMRGAEGEERRTKLWQNVDRFRALVGDLATPALPRLRSPIHPFVVGSNERALELSARLFDAGWHVQAIRPPTVPEGAARLRVTICAGHEPAQLEAFAADLRACSDAVPRER